MSRVARTAVLGGLFLSLLLAASVLILPLAPWHRVHSDYLSVSEVCRRWGERPLDIAEFRAAMACSLLKNQDDFFGMHHLEIRPLFGNFSGYYYTELYPTYLIEVAETKNQDTWQIVFLLGRDRAVSKVVVHKNCC